MLNILSSRKISHFLFTIFLFLSQIIYSQSVVEDSCKSITSYTNTQCFNEKIIFYDTFRGGHFETLDDGTLIIEYSSNNDNSKRMFYGLKKNGRYYFPNETSIKIFHAKNPDNENHGRYESKNKIVYMAKDKEKKKQYLFSTSIYQTVTELHDIQGGNSTYWDTVNFWEIIEIFSYEILILDLPESNENHYVCVFTQRETEKRKVREGVWEHYSRTFSIRKFKFDSPTSYTMLAKYDYRSNYNSRMISAFVVQEWQLIVIFFLKRADTSEEEYTNAKYSIAFFDYSLNWRDTERESENLYELNSGNGIFFRSVWLKGRWAAFLYFKDKIGKQLVFEIGELNNCDGGYCFKYRNTYPVTIWDKWYTTNTKYNDFFKVDENRLVFVTSGGDLNQLGFIVIDLYNDYWNYIIRSYFYNDVDDKLANDMQGYTFNGYIIFTFGSRENNVYSTLLFLGYANGTDFEIDISPYLSDTGYHNENDNLYNRLMESCVIDNNIFGYQIIPKINLVYYPDELFFYNGTGTKREKNKLPFNTFFDANHTLNQNRALNKTHKLYHIDYQFLVKEPPYDTFYETFPHEILADNTNKYFEKDYKRKTFYGRTNRLFFKLCHDYCGSCIEFGRTIHDQRCMTCLEDYSFDYWYYLKKYIPNCIPEGYFYNNVTRLVEK